MFRYGTKTCNHNAGWCHLCAIRNLLPLLCSRNVVSQCDTKTRYHKYCTTTPVAVICFLTRNLVPDLSRCPQLVVALGTLGHYIFGNLVPVFFIFPMLSVHWYKVLYFGAKHVQEVISRFLTWPQLVSTLGQTCSRS